MIKNRRFTYIFNLYQIPIYAVFAICFIGIVIIYNSSFITLEPNIRGTIGDMYGFSNAIFSGLAFAGIIITILLQRNELKLQREELSETRNELKRSASAQEKMEKQQQRQSVNLKKTAELNALGTLVNFYSDLSQNNIKNIQTRNEAEEKARIYIGKIERILNEKQLQ